MEEGNRDAALPALVKSRGWKVPRLFIGTFCCCLVAGTSLGHFSKIYVTVSRQGVASMVHYFFSIFLIFLKTLAGLCLRALTIFIFPWLRVHKVGDLMLIVFFLKKNITLQEKMLYGAWIPVSSAILQCWTSWKSSEKTWKRSWLRIFRKWTCPSMWVRP